MPSGLQIQKGIHYHVVVSRGQYDDDKVIMHKHLLHILHVLVNITLKL